MNRPFATITLTLALGLAARADEPASKDKAPSKPEPSAVLMDVTLKGTIGEDPAPTGLDGAPIKDNLKGIIDRIAKAKADKEVKGLVVRLRDLKVGWAKGYELRRAIEDFRRSGKKTFAVLEMAENADYLVATAADEIVMPEGGWLLLKGLAAEVTFYKKAFDKLGLKADMLQMGEYKGAGEPYTRTEMSPAFREELTAILADDYDQMVDAISRRQGIARDEAKKLIDGGPYTPHGAKAAGLVNRVAYPDQLETEIARGLGLKAVRLDPKYGKPKSDMADLSGFAGFMKMMQMLSGEGLRKPASKKPKVALIYAAGLIRTGKSSSGSLLGDAVMGSDTVIQHLREAEKDPTVKAIVLRVDSRGGSALASDLMWREVVRIEKPIVASMSDYAASGGYYLSMGADKVFAEPGTITGSIGVIGGKIAVGGLLEKLGVTTDTITVGKNGTFLSMTKPFTDDEKAAMRRLMEETYKQFVSKAAEGRKMKYDDLEKLARGRVYTGRRAKELGLVDEVGTLDDALAAAKTLGDLGEDSELLILPRPRSLLESLLDPLEDRDVEARALAPLLPDSARRALGRLAGVARLLESEPAALIGPCEIDIR
ncbi:MAG TPA: signal peptide peptidase SppA [Isosphaeraceae bacterium]|jgi:protease-4|nr:signal peptide peptidase SppA [Isosphaeraceae bacterium]